MKKVILITVIILFSCNQKQNLILKTNNPVWVAYQGYHFETELIICGLNENTKIELTKKLNDTDSLVKSTDNTFIYKTDAKEIGQHTIKGIISNAGTKTAFEQEIVVLPKAQPIGYNIKNATTVTIHQKNEIAINLGLPKSVWKAKTNNGKLMQKGDNFILIPDRLGKCTISFETTMPDGKQILYDDLIFDVIK
ncbi:MAG: hypothetical protein DCE86_15950 [Flavobacteriaceae bacterium]|nr:MAG: hypothetical protein DCE86_15950 [Flavobacteriaceae bacterium]